MHKLILLIAAAVALTAAVQPTVRDDNEPGTIKIKHSHQQLQFNGIRWNGLRWNGLHWNGFRWNGVQQHAIHAATDQSRDRFSFALDEISVRTVAD